MVRRARTRMGWQKMMYEFDLHLKTVVAYVFHTAHLTSPYRSLNEDYEQLYHKALQNVLYQAYSILKETGKDRITVKLNQETARMLYHRAVQATSEYVELDDIACFPSYDDGIEELVQDLENICKKCNGVISLSYVPDPRLRALCKEISRGCKIVA